MKKWLEEVKEHADPDIVVMLVGNKLDICEKKPIERKVSYDRAKEFARENDMFFVETSAFTDINVRDAFETLVQEIYNVKSREAPNQNRTGGRPLVHHDPSLEKTGRCQCL